MKHQQGYVWLEKGVWFGRWFQDEIVDGKVVRRQRARKLCERSNSYRNKKDVRPLLDTILAPINAGRSSPQGTLTVAEYVEHHYLPDVTRRLKPSTANGYRALWQMYLAPRLQKISMRDCRCVDITKVLEAIHRDRRIGRLTLRHCKALLSGVFVHAKRAGVIDGENPAKDSGIPPEAAAANPTHAYSLEEVLVMLEALDGVARAAVALMYFGGLRPGEARAAKWVDFDPDKKTLRIRSSMWRTHLTDPKTEESAGVVPVGNIVAEILTELPRTSEFILAGSSGVAVDLHNLAARVIRPALGKCAECREDKHDANGHQYRPVTAWRGYYSLRRGLATLATSIDTPMAAKSLLRHGNIATTQAHYIKSVPAEAVRAMDKINALVDNAEGRPN